MANHNNSKSNKKIMNRKNRIEFFIAVAFYTIKIRKLFYVALNGFLLNLHQICLIWENRICLTLQSSWL